MKVFVTYPGESIDFLRAVAGGVSRGIYLDGAQLGLESIGYICTVMEDQGYIAVMKVDSAQAMKREFEGLAIVYGIKPRIKSGNDAKTLVIPAEKPDEEKDRDNAIEKILEFFKKHKVKLSI